VSVGCPSSEIENPPREWTPVSLFFWIMQEKSRDPAWKYLTDVKN
jgi:hypothetical protein